MRATPMILLFSLTCLTPAFGEKAPMSPERKRARASDVVVAQVGEIAKQAKRKGGYSVTHYTAKLTLLEVEKGELAPGGAIVVRYWTQRWVGFGMPPTGTNGHAPLPARDDVWRVYLVRKGEELHVLFRDGFERARPIAAARVAGRALTITPRGEKQPAVSWRFAEGQLTVEVAEGATLPAWLSKQLTGAAGAQQVTARYRIDGARLVLSELRSGGQPIAERTVSLSATSDASGKQWYLGGGVTPLK